MGDAAVAYVGHVLDLIAAEWFRADDVDWPEMRGRYLASATAAGAQEQCHGIVEALLGELGDGHSHLIRPGRAAAIAKRPPAPPTGWMRGRAACLDVPGFMRNQHVSREAFAGRLQASLASLDVERPAGWVVDLRRNGGSDMWPMLVGLGPMLGEGPLGFFIAAQAFAWTYRDGAVFNDGFLMCRCEGVPTVIRYAGPRVAVLIGPGTASAGEAVCIAFEGRPGTKLFGQPTAGQSTANTSHVLSDGAVLALTTAVMADRSGVIYGRAIEPDVTVSFAGDDGVSDATLDQALAWVTGTDRAGA